MPVVSFDPDTGRVGLINHGASANSIEETGRVAVDRIPDEPTTNSDERAVLHYSDAKGLHYQTELRETIPIAREFNRQTVVELRDAVDKGETQRAMKLFMSVIGRS